jgi:membrane-associated phospholipid phosphatase
VGKLARAAVAATGAVAVAAWTSGGPGRALDHRVYRRVNASGGPGTHRFFQAITELGSIWASVAAGSVLALSGRRREAVDAVGAAAAMWCVGQVVKRAVARPRPYHALDEFELLIDPPRATSWPSSHPAVLLAFLLRAGASLGHGPGTRAAEAALAGTVGVSRVYLGVHYPADVTGGVLIGIAVADLWSALVSPRLLGGGGAPTP